jgi:hypothetical protein
MQSLREEEMVNERWRQNFTSFEWMSQQLDRTKLGKPTKAVLLKFANEIADKWGIRRPDRICRRQRRALICWFCEHTPVVMEELTILSRSGEMESVESSCEPGTQICLNPNSAPDTEQYPDTEALFTFPMGLDKSSWDFHVSD